MVGVLVIVLIALVLLIAVNFYGGVGPRRVRRRVVVEEPAERVVEQPVSAAADEPAARTVEEPGLDEPYVEERIVRRPVRTRRTRRVVD